MQIKLSHMRVEGDPSPVSSANKNSEVGQKTTSRAPAKTKKQGADGNERDLGQALRTVYQQTVDETIPAEMLDLLGKLG